MTTDYKDPNEFKVVTIRNVSDFDFTPELGAMFDQRPFFIGSGDSLQAPYAVAMRLAENLAKAMLVRKSPGPVTGAGDDKQTMAGWNSEDVKELVRRIVQGEFEEEKAPVLSETDKLMAKVEELNRVVTSMKDSSNDGDAPVAASEFRDKAEVIAELTRREIPFDRRSTKASLEKLLA